MMLYFNLTPKINQNTVLPFLLYIFFEGVWAVEKNKRGKKGKGKQYHDMISRLLGRISSWKEGDLNLGKKTRFPPPLESTHGTNIVQVKLKVHHPTKVNSTLK